MCKMRVRIPPSPPNDNPKQFNCLGFFFMCDFRYAIDHAIWCWLVRNYLVLHWTIWLMIHGLSPTEQERSSCAVSLIRRLFIMMLPRHNRHRTLCRVPATPRWFGPSCWLVQPQLSLYCRCAALSPRPASYLQTTLCHPQHGPSAMN